MMMLNGYELAAWMALTVSRSFVTCRTGETGKRINQYVNEPVNN